MILTRRGVEFLMKYYPRLIPDISETSISDRSSVNSLGKAILLWQTSWFGINCVARKKQHLSLSVLEVITAARSVSTLVTYLLWWRKPLRVTKPTLIEDTGEDRAVAKICAFLTIHSDERYDGWGPRRSSEFQLMKIDPLVMTEGGPSQHEDASGEHLDSSDQHAAGLSNFRLPGREIALTSRPPKFKLPTPAVDERMLLCLYRSGDRPWYATRQPTDVISLTETDLKRGSLRQKDWNSCASITRPLPSTTSVGRITSFHTSHSTFPKLSHRRQGGLACSLSLRL